MKDSLKHCTPPLECLQREDPTHSQKGFLYIYLKALLPKLQVLFLGKRKKILYLS